MTATEEGTENLEVRSKRPYAGVLRHMELNGLVKVRVLGSSNKVSIAVRRGT